MRALCSSSTALAWTIVFTATGLAACGGGTAVQVTADAVADRAVDAQLEPDASDAPADFDEDAQVDGASDVVVEPADARVDGPSEAKVDGSADVAPADVAPADLAPEAAPADGAPTDAAKETTPDLPAEKPSATASWTIAPDPMCTAAGAGCMDTGAVGGYQVTASGTCPVASSVQLWFPGGASPLAAATYTVKPAAGILDVIAMPAGMVAVSVERGGVKSWGRSGSAAVTVAGAGRRVTLSNVPLKQEGAIAMTSLTADVTCP